MAKKVEITTKKKYLTHTDSIYQVTFKNGAPKSCECVSSSSGLLPENKPFLIDERQIKRQLDFNLWSELI